MEAQLPLQNRSKPRQIFYLLLALIGLVAMVDILAIWHI
jgi:hypothetical protein